MERSIRNELKQHLIDTIEYSYSEEDTDFEELHFKAFNEDYYIIGHYKAMAWIDQHELDVFDIIANITEWERDNFGEVNLKPEDINPNKIVNIYVYILGEKLLQELDIDDLSNTTYSEIMDALE